MVVVEVGKQDGLAFHQLIGKELAFRNLGLALVCLAGQAFGTGFLAMLSSVGVEMADPPDARAGGPLKKSSVLSISF